MARPKKDNADYFSHDKDMRNDRKVKALRSKFGLTGYACYVMLIETLTGASGLNIINEEIELELLAGDFDIELNLLKEILNYMDKIKLISVNDIISCEQLNERLKPVFDKRNKSKERFLEQKPELKEVSVTETPQSKEQYIKKDYSKKDYIKKDYSKILLSELKSSDFDNPKYFNITILFHNLFIKNLTDLSISTVQLKKATGKWIDPIRLMYEVDECKKEDFDDVYKFLQVDNFWKKNILSTSKLREKFDKLLMNARTGKNSIIKNGRIGHDSDF